MSCNLLLGKFPFSYRKFWRIINPRWYSVGVGSMWPKWSQPDPLLGIWIWGRDLGMRSLRLRPQFIPWRAPSHLVHSSCTSMNSPASSQQIALISVNPELVSDSWNQRALAGTGPDCLQKGVQHPSRVSTPFLCLSGSAPSSMPLCENLLCAGD